MKKGICILITLLIFSLSIVLIQAEDLEVLEKVDFEDMSVGSLSGSSFATDWELQNPAGTAPTIREEDGNKFLRMDGYSQIVSPHIMESEEYTFETKIRLNKGNRWVGFFVRAADAVLRTNPFHTEYREDNQIGMHIHFYEIDWYHEAMKKGDSNLSGSGIAVFPRKEYVRVAIKTYIQDALNLGIAYHDFAYPEGVDPISFVKYTVKDNGTDTVEIYINDSLLTTINFSEVVTYDEDPHDNNEYYSLAVMKDREGNEVDLYDSEDQKIETLNNARIACFSHFIAFASRTESYDIDDIVISRKAEEKTAEPTKTPTESTETPLNTPTSTPGSTPAEESDGANPLAIGITIGAIVLVIVFIGYFVISFKKYRGGKSDD